MDRSYVDLKVLCSLIESMHQRISRQEQLIRVIAKEMAEMKESELARVQRLEFLESEIPDLRHRVDRGIELEYLENPYSHDGDPRCNLWY
jgi:hypothetical protein